MPRLKLSKLQTLSIPTVIFESKLCRKWNFGFLLGQNKMRTRLSFKQTHNLRFEAAIGSLFKLKRSARGSDFSGVKWHSVRVHISEGFLLCDFPASVCSGWQLFTVQ